MSLFGFIPFVFETAAAQSSTTVSAETGVLLLGQPKTQTSPVLFVLLDGRRAARTTAVSGSALFAQAEHSTAMQGQFGAELAVPALPALRVEVSGTATRFDALANRAGSSRNGFVRPQYVRERFGAFGTFGGGVTSRGKDGFHALASDAGIWARHRGLVGSFSVRHSYTNDYDLVEGSGLTLARQARHYSIRDFTGFLSIALPRLDLQLSGATRGGFAETIGSSTAFAGLATVQLNSRIDVIVNGGKQMADLLTGVPQTNVAGASLRVHLFRRPVARAIPVSAGTIDTDGNARVRAPFATQVMRHASGGATVIVRVDATPDARVEISGTFNDWKPVVIVRGANGFEHSIELPSGTHRIAVRVNGGEWKAPQGLARIVDDLGGEAGLVVVP